MWKSSDVDAWREWSVIGIFSLVIRTMTVSLGEQEGQALVAARPDTYEAIRRHGTRFLGLRVELSRVSPRQARELIECSWRHSAPRRLIRAEGGE